ncbi:catalase [Ascochyta rabiei]|uniref:Catalase n=1 Tax=Didymella rabiei TaxID=5454 RepID=A0A162YQZ8_DIDRA|nr:catalase [Ascochyta rabiei]
MQLREKYFHSPLKLGAATKLGTDPIKQAAPFMLPNTNMISHSLYTQSALKFGEWYGRIILFPVLDEMTSRNEKYARSEIQLGTDPSYHPTEDGSVVWDKATVPYQTIATVEFPPQDALTAKRRTFWEDKTELNPGDALTEDQPLESISRLTKTVYEISRKNREAINATQTKRVRSVDELP